MLCLQPLFAASCIYKFASVSVWAPGCFCSLVNIDWVCEKSYSMQETEIPPSSKLRLTFQETINPFHPFLVPFWPPLREWMKSMLWAGGPECHGWWHSWLSSKSTYGEGWERAKRGLLPPGAAWNKQWLKPHKTSHNCFQLIHLARKTFICWVANSFCSPNRTLSWSWASIILDGQNNQRLNIRPNIQTSIDLLL